MKLWAWILVLIAAAAPTTLFAQGGRVVFVLDGSNSMWGRIDGTEKIVVARDVLSQVLSELPSDMQVGFAAYGHRRENDCDDIETILAVGDHPPGVMEQAIRSVQPRGMTPITAALQHVAEGLEDMPGPTHLVLVSDGKETCDRDPCAMVSSLREKGIDLTVHVVGFDVTGEEGEQLQCIAEAGGGLYAGAGTADELTAALAEIRETVVEGVAVHESPRDPERPYWRLDAGENSYEGKISYVNRGDDRLAIQLVNLDAVNLGMRLPGEGEMERPVDHAFFAVGRGPTCELVASDPPFQIRFDKSDDGWMDGSFSGMLACPDYSALPVQGSFHIPDRGEQ